MITTVHIEDEPRNVELLQNLLTTHCTKTINYLGFAGNIEDAYTLIKKQKPQLVFLDIELNKGNAFDLLDKIDCSFGINFEIIFITAFNEYALKAFRLNAIDYLLKPISTKELKQAVERAKNKIQDSHINENNLNNILKQLSNNITTKKIGITIAEGVEFVLIDDIVKLEAKGSYTTIYLKPPKKITCTKGIGELESLLPSTIFIRVHNAWIINSHHLKKYIKGKSGYIEMDDNTIVPVSIRKKR